MHNSLAHQTVLVAQKAANPFEIKEKVKETDTNAVFKVKSYSFADVLTEKDNLKVKMAPIQELNSGVNCCFLLVTSKNNTFWSPERQECALVQAIVNKTLANINGTLSISLSLFKEAKGQLKDLVKGQVVNHKTFENGVFPENAVKFCIDSASQVFEVLNKISLMEDKEDLESLIIQLIFTDKKTNETVSKLDIVLLQAYLVESESFYANETVLNDTFHSLTKKSKEIKPFYKEIQSASDNLSIYFWLETEDLKLNNTLLSVFNSKTEEKAEPKAGLKLKKYTSN